MKTSANAMKATVKESDLDKADELMEDMNEAMDQINEMNEAMSQPIGPMMDEDELDAELAALEELEADEMFNEMPIASQKNVQHNFDANVMPDAPDSAISLDIHSITFYVDLTVNETLWFWIGITDQPTAQEEEDELAELEAMMNWLCLRIVDAFDCVPS